MIKNIFETVSISKKLNITCILCSEFRLLRVNSVSNRTKTIILFRNKILGINSSRDWGQIVSNISLIKNSIKAWYPENCLCRLCKVDVAQLVLISEIKVIFLTWVWEIFIVWLLCILLHYYAYIDISISYLLLIFLSFSSFLDSAATV